MLGPKQRVPIHDLRSLQEETRLLCSPATAQDEDISRVITIYTTMSVKCRAVSAITPCVKVKALERSGPNLAWCAPTKHPDALDMMKVIQSQPISPWVFPISIPGA